ncbi:MAG TPA: HAD hydrolase-like protein [Rhizomicrobium sp.]|nr:HAD hydrolase-like protein [Rhizomicrobium sp.]HWC62301.1 HAD hydrolase-like protein [Rhizomicrobium sp.]
MNFGARLSVSVMAALLFAMPSASAASIKLVVLDIGGTLIQDHNEVPTALMSALGKEHIPVTAAEISDWRGASKKGMIRHFVERTMKHSAASEKLVDKINADFNAQASKAYADVQPIAGAEDALKQMKAEGLMLATTTGFGRQLEDQVIKHLGWEKYFTVTISSDDVVDGRPAPYMIYHAMEAAHVNDVKDVVVVGDTPLDLQAANNSGAKGSIGVWSGAATKEKLEKEKYSQLLPSVASLPELLKKSY